MILWFSSLGFPLPAINAEPLYWKFTDTMRVEFLYFLTHTLWEKMSCTVSAQGTLQWSTGVTQQHETGNLVSSQTLPLEIAGGATEQGLHAWKIIWMQPLCCAGLGGHKPSPADAEVSVQPIITGYQWGSGRAQDPAVQTHSWRNCPCSTNLPILVLDFLNHSNSQCELVMLPKERSLSSLS